MFLETHVKGASAGDGILVRSMSHASNVHVVVEHVHAHSNVERHSMPVDCAQQQPNVKSSSS